MYKHFEKLCELHNVKPSVVAREAGIAHQSVSAWKRGEYTPKIDKLQKIADYFQVPVEYLIKGKEAEHYYINDDAREFAQFMFDNPKYKVLFSASRKVKEEDIDIVKQLLDKFASDEEGEVE